MSFAVVTGVLPAQMAQVMAPTAVVKPVPEPAAPKRRQPVKAEN